jgi:molybdopterin-containing oxidoreductase family membrane subunit
MAGHVYSPLRQPLVLGDKTMADITNDVCRSIEGKPSMLWWLGFLGSGAARARAPRVMKKTSWSSPPPSPMRSA